MRLSRWLRNAASNRHIVLSCVALIIMGSAFIAEAQKKGKKQVTKIDMAAYTCEEMLKDLKEDEENAGVLIIWIDGYLSGKTDDTVIDMGFLENLGKGIGTECSKTPQAKVLEVVKRVTQ